MARSLGELFVKEVQSPQKFLFSSLQLLLIDRHHLRLAGGPSNAQHTLFGFDVVGVLEPQGIGPKLVPVVLQVGRVGDLAPLAGLVIQQRQLRPFSAEAEIIESAAKSLGVVDRRTPSTPTPTMFSSIQGIIERR